MTLEEILAFLKTKEGKEAEKQIVTNYIQNDVGGKELLEGVMAPELLKAKKEAQIEWETIGGGKKLKDHNAKLLGEIKGLKEGSTEIEKYKNLLDISAFSDYNELEKAILTMNKDGLSDNEELIKLKQQNAQTLIRNRELESENKQVQEKLDSSLTAIQDSDSYIADTLIRNEIKSTLLKQGFDENQATGLVHRVSQLGNFKVEKDPLTGDRRAINDTGLTPEIYTLKDYLVTEEGKAFKPNKATGGGSGGDLGGVGAGGSKKFGDLTYGERNAWSIKDPEAYKTAHDKWKVSKQI